MMTQGISEYFSKNYEVKTMIEVKNLTKSFRKKKVLDNISFALKEGTYGLLGANGAGKTTLLRCLTMIYPEGGKTVLKNGKPIEKEKEYLSKVGYLPQQFGLFKELSVTDAIKLLANFKFSDRRISENEIDRCLKLVNLEEEKNKRVSALSGGMLRRVGIAQAILGEPDIIIFDEPTAGLDPTERLRFKSVISEIKNGKNVIISTHIVEDIEAVCNQVIIMDSGKINGVFTCRELRAIAKEKVYEIAENESDDIGIRFYTEKIFEREGKAYKRILCSDPLPLSTCEPTLEDGYLCIINKI